MRVLALAVFILVAIPLNLASQTKDNKVPYKSQKADTSFLRKHFYFRSPERERDIIGAEQYPGSERFYARRPFLPHVPGRFNMKPDTTEKYYLIIKDPLLNKIVN